ncbi:putative dehydrogenase [Saccharopolyspora lacisalsi]|uniref:Putative dehydrogenase n=1 Tax=Halosaccharopolyspora lacisalsi TaxID=1000566 RepID=A0A839DZJ6_9PSEU|nr:Gfo/Idh/MocA family oxidoreductase [Halosaccharopolyspora lacisalsi]MBA8826119.1 putative dehydrogenase [Halosaccharopolyspora lacisalsi]
MRTTSTNKPRTRAVIVGAGAVAASHLTAFRAFGDEVELVAAVDPDESRLNTFCARVGHVRGYTDLHKMLDAERPDLVSICTPPALHVDQVVRVLRAGAWVWCEKPPCLSLAGYDEIVAAESDRGPYASFVFQHRFGSAARHARQLIAARELGRPLVAHCQTTWYRDADYFAVPWRGRWETEGGGPSIGHGVHQMDLMLHLLGPWTEVRAMTGRLVHDVETEDVSTALVRFDSGAMATVVNSVVSPDEVSRIRLDCSDATVELTHLYGYGNEDWVYTPAPHVTDATRVKHWRGPPECEPSSHTAMLRHLLAAMDAGERPVCSGAEGRAALEFVAALYKSAATGLPVRSGEIDPQDPFYALMHGDVPERLTAAGEETEA